MSSINLQLFELLGVGYLVDCVVAAQEDDARDTLWRSYMADVARAAARQLGARVEQRYITMLHCPKRDRRSGDEIAADVISRMGLTPMGG